MAYSPILWTGAQFSPGNLSFSLGEGAFFGAGTPCVYLELLWTEMTRRIRLHRNLRILTF
jgi:hypothetical protein